MALGILRQNISSFIEGRIVSFANAPSLMIIHIMDKLLAHVPFHDFIHHFRKERKGGSFKEEDGQYRWFFFLQQHKEHHSHMILETIRESNVCPKYEVVPRVVCTSIPHRESDPESYFLFMLAHFSPFSADH